MFSDFIHLFFPHLCVVCKSSLSARKLHPSALDICLRCERKLPHTKFHLEKDNAITQRLWGRVDVGHATALYFFKKGGGVKPLIHRLKYDNRPDIGVELGRRMASDIMASPYFSSLDLIVPVPLHPKKEQKRGYNQSDKLAEGISAVTGVPYRTDVLMRNDYTESQTRKNRAERLANVSGVFGINHTEELCHKHILLVDDVFTTGATTEQCAELLLQAEGARLSLAVAAIAAR